MTFGFKRRIFQEVTGSDSSPAECPNGIVYNATLSADTVSLMFFCAFICSHVISFSHVLSKKKNIKALVSTKTFGPKTSIK